MPDMSVTIRPNGQAYRVAGEIISALNLQCPTHAAGTPDDGPGCAEFEPHLTLQYVYDVAAADVDRIAAALEGFFRAERVFDVFCGELGTFPSVAGIHVDVDRTPELIDLYARTKQVLEALGQRTYPYDETTWSPHLSLSCRHWSSGDVEHIRAMFPRLDVGFQADRVQINVLEPAAGGPGRWVVLRDVPLLAERAPAAA
jgi:2'-5' RNA ligase